MAITAWKGNLTIWFFTFLPALLFVTPLKGVLKAGLGQSMITERLADGIDIEVFADLGLIFSGLMTFFRSGFLLVLLSGLLLNVFFSGGLFSFFSGTAKKSGLAEFFRASAGNFWSYLVIILIVNLIILVLFILIVVLPVSVIIQSDNAAENTIYSAGVILTSFFLLVLPLLLLVADYARAWQAISEKPACFRALGYGFRQTFKQFLRSYFLMLQIMLIQLLFAAAVFSVLPNLRPVSGSGVFLLFILSQFLVLIRIMLKAWRYGSVTALMLFPDSPAEAEVAEDQQGPVFSQPPDPVLY